MDDILASIRRIIADDYKTGSSDKIYAAPADKADDAAEAGLTMVSEPRGAPEPDFDDFADQGEVATASEPSPEAPGEMVHDEEPGRVLKADFVPSAPVLLRPELHMRPVVPFVERVERPASKEGSEPVIAAEAVEPPREIEAKEEPIAAAEAPLSSPSEADHGSSPADGLLSSAATAAVGEAFQALSSTILTSSNARTLEDIVKDMLRPMLQVWLDDNLPPLVERLVRAEIERVARGHS